MTKPKTLIECETLRDKVESEILSLVEQGFIERDYLQALKLLYENKAILSAKMIFKVNEVAGFVNFYTSEHCAKKCPQNESCEYLRLG